MSEQTSNRASVARRWWRALQPYRGDGSPNPTGDRAALAQLRRAADIKDILVDEAVIELHRQLGFEGRSADKTLPWVAATASALAHVREDDRRRPARAVGRASFEDKNFETAAMKPLRFRRLLAAREPDEVAREMRRLVQLAEGKLDVGTLATAILAWPHPEWGDSVRTHWAYDYFAAGDAAPSISTSSTEMHP